MEISWEFVLVCFTTYIAILNPVSVIPVFLTMTTDLDRSARRRVAWKAVLTAFITMVLFAFSGQFIFSFFSITVDSFRVVGGIIFFMMGWDMLQARLIRTKIDSEDVKSYVTDISVTPLGIPMISGPGAITNSIVLMEDANGTGNKIMLFVVMTIVLLITLVSLLSALSVTRFMGETGTKVLLRLMGLIIMVIAVEFFFSGLKPILQGIFFPAI